MDETPKDDSGPSKRPPPLASLDVPAFPCIVYLRKVEGGMIARVANLDGIEVRGNSERELLSKIVPEFKRLVAGWHQRDEAIPWIDPIPEPAPGEAKRFLPVHL